MADQVLKTVRITDNIKVEVLQQGKKRKYALFYDGDTEFITRRGRGSYEETDKNNNTKSEKYDIAMSDDDVIEMALKAYNSRFGSPQKKWYITQKVYSDPAPARTYGNGDKSPYYLNNGCAINIQWVGKIPNPEFNPGTYSNLYDAEKAGERDGKPRYLENSTITSTTDNANNSDILPKSSWSVSPPILDDIFDKDLVPVDYRDTSYVQNKIVTVTLPKGFTENGGKGYLVWTEGGLEYDSKSIPENTPTKMAYVDGVYRDVGYRKPKNQIRYFEGHRSDAYVIEQVINVFLSKVLSLHNDLPFPYDLELCAPDNETCSLIPYKSPLEAPNNTPQQAVINDIPPPVPIQSGKLKLSIQGLFENEDGTTPGSTASVFEIKAKTNMPAFTIWTGEIPQTEEIDQFENLPELDEEYNETDFQGDGENINTFEEIELNTQEANQNPVKSPNLPPSGTPPQGSYVVANMEPDTFFDASKLPIPPGFNGVPLYHQHDTRWAKYNYGVGKKMACTGRAAGTVRSSGCMPSSLSMMINYWAKKGYCKPTRPDVVAQFCLDYGGRICGDGGSLFAISKGKFKEVFGLNIVAFSNIGDDKVRTLLSKGFPVNHGGATTGKTAKGRSKSYGAHYLVMTGIDEQGRIRINDSGNAPMGGSAITYYTSTWSSANSKKTSQSYLYPDALGNPL